MSRLALLANEVEHLHRFHQRYENTALSINITSLWFATSFTGIKA
jgi:hypothetical protein